MRFVPADVYYDLLSSGGLFMCTIYIRHRRSGYIRSTRQAVVILHHESCNNMMKTLIVFLAVVAIVAASSYGYGYDENNDGLNDR